MSAPTETREPIYHCEACGRPIYAGDKALRGGPDDVVTCEEHSPWLSDDIRAWEDDVANEDEPDWPEWWDTREEAEAHIARLRADLEANGNRNLAEEV